ncbi:hypothetical protein [Pseudomonas veronii]|uniref:hypothetical protein n=1 Tax=Pseudomonas veronii TaxID=76761 RepID=UPI0031F9A073
MSPKKDSLTTAKALDMIGFTEHMQLVSENIALWCGRDVDGKITQYFDFFHHVSQHETLRVHLNLLWC